LTDVHKTADHKLWWLIDTDTDTCSVRRCTTNTSVSTLTFKQYWHSSVISWSHHLWSFQSYPPRWKQCAYLVVNVFSGSVTTKCKERWDIWKVGMSGHWEQKNYEDQFKML